jgi:predicted MFS family arabinose efflux permease
VLGSFGIGSFGALLAITIQANLSEQHGPRRAQAIAELNVLASACAVSSTVAIGAAERTGIGWRGALLLAVVGYLGIVLTFRRVRINPIVPPGTNMGVHGRGRRGLPGTYYAYALVISLGVAVEWCLVFWAADFLERSAGLARADAATAMSAFFVAMVLGRFAGSRLAARMPSAGLLQGALLLTGTGFLVFWLAPLAVLSVIGLFLTGLGTANLFPATYASALDAAPGQPDIASARLTVCGGSAVLLIPLILGLLADAIGIEWAFGIVIPLVAGALTTVVLAQRLARTSIERSRPRDGLPA